MLWLENVSSLHAIIEAKKIVSISLTKYFKPNQ